VIRAAALAALLMLPAGVAAAQFNAPRTLTEREKKLAIEALLREPGAALSEDPSCKSDLSQPGAMSIAQGLAVALVRAATDDEAVNVTADCFVRKGYPLAAGEEYCRLALTPPDKPRSSGYGLVFKMNWGAGKVTPGSVECY
jgi:uncharacterized protein YfiM (DUF2279 family)